MQARFDPQWLREGEFDLSNDPRAATRTVKVRQALERLEGGRLRLVKHSSRGRTPGYYLREGKRGEVEAQYYMSIDRDLRTLALGLSVEKGEEHSGCDRDRKMDRHSWDWPKLVAMGAPRLADSLSVISSDLGRPLAVVLDTHRKANAQEERETVPFVFTGTELLVQSAPVGIEVLFARLREIDRRKDWWADVWIVADFTELEVGRLSPDDVAQRLYAFRPLRDALRGRSSGS